MTRPAPYTQAEVKRAVKGALDAGLKVREVIATAEGVRIIAGDPVAQQDGKGRNWDEVLDAS